MPTDVKFREHYYELSQIFDHVDYWAMILLGILIGAALFLTGKGMSAIGSRTRYWFDLIVGAGGLIVLVMVVWVIAFRPTGNVRVDPGEFFGLLGVAAAGVFTLSLFILINRDLLSVIVRFAVLSTSPIVIVLAINAYVSVGKITGNSHNILTSDRTLAPKIVSKNRRNGPRIVYLIFDMWDFRLTFEKRPDWLKLPQIDRLAAQSFVASNAIRTSPYTRFAMPGIVLGHKVMWAEPIAGDDLGILPAETTDLISWRANPGFFRSARNAGYNTTIVAAAYHPWCRLFSKLITDCWIDDTPFSFDRRTVFNRLDDGVKEVLRFVPSVKNLLFGEKNFFHENWGVHLYFATREKLRSAASDPDVDFLFAHVMLPHPPFIRHYKTGEWRYFDEAASRIHYFGNMQAMDEMIGEIRAGMEETGLWEDTVILLSSDHGYTLSDFPEYVPESDPRVPFILKLPGGKSPFKSDKRFMTTSVRILLEALFAGVEVKPETVEQYLDYPIYYH